MAKILIISSQVHKDLAHLQLNHCLELFKHSPHQYEVMQFDAGCYEIPYIINTFDKKGFYDAYVALGLVLKTNNDHYDYIMSHIKYCFSKFALSNIVVGNGIISGASIEELQAKIASKDSCFSVYASAYKAVDALLKLKF